MIIVTRRRDQRGFKGNPVGADQIIGGIIVCETREARQAWVERLNRRHPLRFNYFVMFDDVRGPALQFAHAHWASVDHPHVMR
jgi:hypothetical protein